MPCAAAAANLGPDGAAIAARAYRGAGAVRSTIHAGGTRCRLIVRRTSSSSLSLLTQLADHSGDALLAFDARPALHLRQPGRAAPGRLRRRGRRRARAAGSARPPRRRSRSSRSRRCGRRWTASRPARAAPPSPAPTDPSRASSTGSTFRCAATAGRAAGRGRGDPRRDVAPARRAGDGRDREPLPQHGRRVAGAALDGGHRRAVHVLQPDLAHLHRPQHRGGVGRRLGRERALRGLRALHEHLRAGVQRARGVRDGVPAAPPRRRIPLDPRSRHASLHADWRLRRLHRIVHRHHRAPAAGAGAARRRAGARRVPVDRVARAGHADHGAAPAGRDAAARAATQDRRAADRRDGRRDRGSDPAAVAAGRDAAGRLAHRRGAADAGARADRPDRALRPRGHAHDPGRRRRRLPGHASRRPGPCPASGTACAPSR